MSTRLKTHRVDQVGTLASATCAIHCVLSAFLPSVLSLLGLTSLLGHGAEWGFVGIAVFFALLALGVGLYRGYPKINAVLLFVGIIALLASRALEEMHFPLVGTGVSVLAACSLIAGHIKNIRDAHRASVETS